ncbi:MAG TPA: hypothetical protein VKV80_11360 [Streptosporangiaceae bacterium]|nr:hypothetical protein [Streptosporangiaceae bacterium]
MLHDGAAFGRIIAALEGRGCRVTGSGRQRQAQCPAHDDRNPSLSVTYAAGRVLVHCHAGCDTDDVLAVFSLTRADLYDAPAQRRDGGDDWMPADCCHKAIARYPYIDEHGELLYEVLRCAHKQFRQRRPDPYSRSGWRWRLDDTRRILYHLPQLLAAPGSACIFITEGEKDVHALEAAGEVATCPPMGAGKWRPEYAEPLAGRDVLVVADRDEPGRDHAWQVLTSIRPVTRSAWIVQAAAGKDAADHLAAGYGVCDLTWWNL